MKTTIIEDTGWRRSRRGNEGTHRRVIQQRKRVGAGLPTITVRTEAWFESNSQQSFVRAHLWTGASGWQFIYAADIETWMIPGPAASLNYPYFRGSENAAEFLTSERGQRAEQVFQQVQEMAWQIVGWD